MHEVVQLLTCFVLLLAREIRAGNANGGMIQEYTANSRNSSQKLDTIIEFRSRMLQAISTFPVSRQCTLLSSILKQSGENISPIVEKLIYAPHQHLPCLRGASNPGSVVNTSVIRQATNFEVSRLFNDLPKVYKCLILSNVAMAIHGETSKQYRASKASLQETMATLIEELPLDDITGKCTNVRSRHLPTKTYIRLGIRLRKLMSLKVWLKRFNTKLPLLYVKEVSKSGKISEVVSNWKRNENGDKIPVIPRGKFVVKMQEDIVKNDNVVIVTFSLMSRQDSGEYTAVNGEDVAASFKHMRRSQLNNLLQAEVIGWSAFVGDDSEHTQRKRNRKKKLSEEEIQRLQALFPRYLLKFFKSMSGFNRCYILNQISRHLNQELVLVEQSYYSLGSLQKKHFCSRASKKDLTIMKSRPLSIWDEIDRLTRIIPQTATPSVQPSVTTALAENATIIRETRPFNSMELVMFALLGFLCVLIMVFVANCIVFTFKTKQLNSKYDDSTINPQNFVETDDDNSKHPETNEAKLNISENPLRHFHDDQRHYDFLNNDGPLSAYGVSDSEANLVVDQKCEICRTTRKWDKTNKPKMIDGDVSSGYEDEIDESQAV